MPALRGHGFRRRHGRAGTLTIELQARSFIRPLGNVLKCVDVCSVMQILSPFSHCPSLAVASCASMPVMGVVSDSESYSTDCKSGNFRVCSQVTFELTCDESGTPTHVQAVKKVSETGAEGPMLHAPPAVFDYVIAEVKAGVAHFGYLCSGRPPPVMEIAILAMHDRTCPWIWHFPLYDVKRCDINGFEGEFDFGGSNFPTRRLWRDSVEKDTVQQGEYADLWKCSPASEALVDGRFPSDFDFVTGGIK